ncbi:MAG: tripartite tricarboxylate transporter substrate binding protein [Sulfurifustaceae bacterium]
MMKRCFACIAAVVMLLVSIGAEAAYPERPITMIVPWGAGGGTDAVARMLAVLMEKDLGQPVNVVNRTGGSGVVGHHALASAAPDGYTIGMLTIEIGMMHHLKLTDLDSTAYTPLALVNGDPAAVLVRADAPYRTLNELVAAIKANPGKLKASGGGQGNIWQLAMAGLLNNLKVDSKALPWVPSNGAAPALNDLVAGGIAVVPCSLPEARALIEAGKVRSLAVMDAQPSALFPHVPTVKQATGRDWVVVGWRGVAAPKGIPAPVQQRLVTALKNAHASAAFRDFMRARGYAMLWQGPDEFGKFMAQSDRDLGRMLRAFGIVN